MIVVNNSGRGERMDQLEISGRVDEGSSLSGFEGIT